MYIKLARNRVLSNAQIEMVKQRLQQGATHSPPPPSVPSSPSSLTTSQNASLVDVLNIARSVISPNNGNEGGWEPLMGGDGSAGDPASVGIAVLLANWTQQQQDNEDYARAATAQVDYLLGPKVPKRSTAPSLIGSDFVYMVPPFLAYYGLTTGNQSMMQEAYNQIRLYRNYLADRSANGLWRHIVLGWGGTDLGIGNGWAAAGMLRVLGTLNRSSTHLENWVTEIHRAMYPYLQSNGLFKNYVDVNGNFDDASSSALLASTPLHPPSRTYPPRPLFFHFHLDRGLFNTPHFTSDGWLTPVVDPDEISKEGAESPEGEAFVLMLYAAWRDWAEVMGNSTNGGGRSANDAASAIPVVGGVVVGLAIIVAWLVSHKIIKIIQHSIALRPF
ncbi:hypothetical protein BGW80DRAFT_1472334 [Lactifluus volemus]|nr:hypothetical protein BGW80DRAFT_1472334 [Lactifluus volemus]